jgi:dethiobiotin synthetase
MQKRGMDVYGVIFNHYPLSAPEIIEDSIKVIRLHLKKYYPNALWGEVSCIKDEQMASAIELSEDWFIQS